MDKFLNILRIIGAFFLSILLFIVLFCAPILSSVSAFIQKDTIQEVIKNIDIVEILQTDESFVSDLNESGLTVDMLDDFFNTNAVDEMIEVYVGDLFNALNGEMKIEFTGDKLQIIANNNMDELMPIFKNMILSQDASIQITDEQLKEGILQVFDELKESLPNVEELGIFKENVDQETKQLIEVIQLFHVGTIVTPFIIAAVILSLLILICRWTKLEGFIWLAIVYGISAGMIFTFSGGLTSTSDIGMIDAPVELVNVLLSAFAVFASKLRSSALILGGCAIIFIGIYIIFHNYKKKRNEEMLLDGFN